MTSMTMAECRSAAPPAAADIDARTLESWLDRNEAVLVDVREPGEHARERIAGAISAPLSRLAADPLPEPAHQCGTRKLVLHCASGARSAQAMQILRARGLEVLHLTGGIAAWKQAGLPVVADQSAPLPIMRQVQIVAGSLALTGVVLGFSVHAAFFILSGIVGAGLLLAGVTGTCMMANLLLKLPYNRA
jgi:rhodanese-related sulfurtransferase